MNLNEQMQNIADELGLTLKKIQPAGYSFKNENFSVLWYEASGAVVVRHNGLKRRTVRSIGRYKLQEFISNLLKDDIKPEPPKSIFITPADAVNKVLKGEKVFYISKKMATSNFSLYEDCINLPIGDFMNGKYVFRLRPKTITINGVEYFSKMQARDEFFKHWNEMV